MGSPPDSILQNQQGKYVRARENPFFDGMRRGDASMINRPTLYGFLGRNSKQKILRSASDIGDRGYRGDIHKNISYISSQGSSLDITREPFGLSIPGNVDFNSSHTADVYSELSSDIEGNNITDVTSPADPKANDTVEKSYSVNKWKQTVSGISLPQSAASFYYGSSQLIDVVESCEGIKRLNLYLKACKDDVNAGVPGRFLRAVLGQEVADVGSVISTIMYSFYLNETEKSSQFCTVPVINVKRADINSHAELIWLLNSCNIDHPSLLFIDEVDLAYYDLFGSLKLILLNADKLPEKQEALKESLVETFNCRKGGLADSSDGTAVDERICSSCALIAEKFASRSPEILVGKGFARLLLAGILLDTGNLTNPQCTNVDRYMSTLLLNGAGQFGCNGLFQILKHKMHNISHLNVGEILGKNFRKWTRTGKGDSGGSRLVVCHVGMSSVGISIPQLLSHDETSAQEIVHFRRLEKLRLLIIASGYYDPHKNFKREMLISAESEDLMEDLLYFLDTRASHLSLHVLNQPGLGDDMRAFTIANIASRRTVEQLLQKFCKT